MTRVGFQVDAYGEGDEPGVLDLLASSLGPGPIGRRSSELFHWKHLDNPFGRSFMLVAREADRVIGLRAFMRWRLRVGNETVLAARAVDTATHPDHQRRGVFSTLTREAVSALRSDTDLIFNTPNDRSGPGYLKMGWRSAGAVPVSIRVLRPARFARRASSIRSAAAPDGPPPEVAAPHATEVLGHPGVERLLGLARTERRRLHTWRDLEYLRWRYTGGPFDYRGLLEERDGDLACLALFRVRSRGRLWETSVTELLADPHQPQAPRQLLGRVRRAARTDHLAGQFPSGTLPAGAARRAGFLKVPWGPTLVVNPLREVRPDPADLRSWALTLGDLEVF